MTFEEILARDGRLIYRNAGDSMKPMIREGRDLLVIRPANGKLKRLDIPLYRRGNGAYVLHRVIWIRKDGYVLCGDNRYRPEYGIKGSQVIGVLTAVVRDGREEAAGSFKWRLFGFAWTLLFPVRALAGKSRTALRRLGKRPGK